MEGNAQAASIDTEIWREILRKAQKGTTNEPYFVVEIQHPSSFCTISLPTVFVEHHRSNLNAAMVLEDQDGYTWHAQLARTWKSEPYISHGWREYAGAHNLQINDRVVFFLVAYAHFMVQVFDANNNEKLRRTPPAECAPISTRKTLNHAENKSEKQDEYEGGLNSGASQAMKGASHQLPSLEVKVEDDGFTRIPLVQPACEINKVKKVGLHHMECSTTDGLKYVQILDTSSDEEDVLTPATATPSSGQKHIDGNTMKSRLKKLSQRSPEYCVKEKFLSPCDEHREKIEGLNRCRSMSNRKNQRNDDTTDLSEHPLIQRDKFQRKSSENQAKKEVVSESDGIFHRNGLKSRREQLGNYEEEIRNTEQSSQKPDSIIAKLLMKDSQRLSPNLTIGDISPGSDYRTIDLDDEDEEDEKSIIFTLLRKDQQRRSNNLESFDVRHGSSEQPLKLKQPKGPESPGHTEKSQHDKAEGRRMQVRNRDGECGPLNQDSSNITERLLMKEPQRGSPGSPKRPLNVSQSNAPTFSGRLATVLNNDGAEGKGGEKPQFFQKNASIKGTVPARNLLSRSPPFKDVSSIEHELSLEMSRKVPQKKGKQNQEEENTLAGYREGVLKLEKLLELSRKWLKEMESLEGGIVSEKKAAESKTFQQPGHNQKTGGPKVGRAGNVASSQVEQAMKKRQGTSGAVGRNTKIRPLGKKMMKRGLAKETTEQDLAAEDVLGFPPVENKDSQTISKKLKIAATNDGLERPQPINGLDDKSEQRELKSQRVAAKSRPKIGVSKTRRETLQRQERILDVSSKRQEISPPKLVMPVYKRPVAKLTREAPSKAQSLLYISKRRPVTNQEREKALSAGQAFAQQITNQKFLMQLRSSQVYCGFHLGVPQEFAEALHIPPTRLTVTLYDFTGKTWEVEWLGDHPRRTGFHSAGWTKFALEHFMEEGDVIVFELPDPLHFNILVHIFPVVELTEFADTWKNNYTLAKEIATSSEGVKYSKES